jgi:hypothetical protein
MISDFRIYKKATKLMGRPKFSDLLDEVKELQEEPSMNELVDVIHSALRISFFPDIIVYLLAYKTANKHVQRMKAYNCPRSLRNHHNNPNCICRKH